MPRFERSWRAKPTISWIDNDDGWFLGKLTALGKVNGLRNAGGIVAEEEWIHVLMGYCFFFS